MDNKNTSQLPGLIDRAKMLLERPAVRYVISGGTSFAVEQAIFMFCLYSLGTKAGLANVVSLVGSWTVNYTLSHYFVFRGHGTKMSRSVPKYIALAVFNLAVTTAIITLLVDHLGLPGFAVKPAVSILAAAWTFFAYKLLIFR
jgi:putative flippase GtrA